MTSVWSTMTYCLLPPAIILLLLLTIPFPLFTLNKGIVRFGDFVFSISIGTLNVFKVITSVAFIILLAQTYDLQRRYAKTEDARLEVHYSADLQAKANRWRLERNWWISFVTFIIYWMLLRFHSVKKQLLLAIARDE